MAESRSFGERITDGLERLNKFTLKLGVLAIGGVVAVEYLSEQGILEIAPQVLQTAGIAVGAAVALDLAGNEGYRSLRSATGQSRN